jgi:hypothetical protein
MLTAHTVALVLLKEPSALTASPRSTSLWYSAAAVDPIAGPIQKIHCAYTWTCADRRLAPNLYEVEGKRYMYTS